MKKNAMSLTIITVISAVTVTILCFGAISKANADFNIQSSSPQDINFTKVKMAQQFEHQLNQHGIPYTKTYENANTHIIENDVIKSKTGNAMQNESISIMADPHIKGNHATITNLQGPLSMMFNVQIHKDLKLKGQQVKTFYVDKKI